MADIDWLSIETQYRAGTKSLRGIADEHGTSEAAIRRRAKKFGWIRDGAQAKREKVKAHFAGEKASKPASAKKVIKAIEVAAGEDIEDMETGLANARLALSVVHHSLIKMQDAIVNDAGDEAALMLLEPKNVKLLSETNKLNIDVIRRIRGLDDPQQQEVNLSEEDMAIMERFKNA